MSKIPIIAIVVAVLPWVILHSLQMLLRMAGALLRRARTAT